MRNLSLAALACAALALAAPATAAADEPPIEPGPFDRGKFGVSAGVGSQDAFDHTYLAIGAGVGYYVLPGLELSLQAEHWFGDDPSVSQVSPRVRYVFWQVPFAFKPYLGTGYTHWFVGDPFDDVDAVAGRAGLTGVVGGALVLGVGAVLERIVSECGDECWSVYPELTLGIAF